MECIKLEGCPFYNDKMPMDQGIGLIFKKKYCHSNYDSCARYQVYRLAGQSYVPANLYPNMADIAQEIIKEVSNTHD